MIYKYSHSILILVFSLLISSCGSAPVKKTINDSLIDILITDTKQPIIKEIIIGGKNHSDDEMEGHIKVRSTNGYLKVKTLGILGWWSSINDEKTYEMDRVEKIVYDLRIKERVKFILANINKDFDSDISNEVLALIDQKLSKSKSDVLVRDEIGLFTFGDEALLTKLTFKIENEICSNSSVAMSKHSARFDNSSILTRIASSHNGIGKFNGFYLADAEKDLLKAIDQFRGILLNNYIGTHFDTSQNCPSKFKFNIGNNIDANIKLRTPNSKRSVLFEKAKNEVFTINAIVDSINFVGGFIPGIEYHQNDFIATTGDGVIRIQNISPDIINIKSIALFYNKNANESIYDASILPGQYLDFEVENNRASKLFVVQNYRGGIVDGGINVGYLLGGQKLDSFINISTRESSIWSNIIFSN